MPKDLIYTSISDKITINKRR